MITPQDAADAINNTHDCHEILKHCSPEILTAACPLVMTEGISRYPLVSRRPVLCAALHDACLTPYFSQPVCTLVKEYAQEGS